MKPKFIVKTHFKNDKPTLVELNAKPAVDERVVAASASPNVDRIEVYQCIAAYQSKTTWTLETAP